MYKVAAGDDRIIDTKEKRTLPDKLGIKTPIDDGETVSFVPKEGSINVYALSGQYGRNIGNGKTNGFLGKISIEDLKDYLKNNK